MQTYSLAFPGDLHLDNVRAFLRSLAGALRPQGFFASTPAVVFETYASDEGIWHRLRLDEKHADAILRQLITLVPGMRVEPAATGLVGRWDYAIEVGMTSPARRLSVPQPENLAASLLASMQTLDEGEAVIMQLVVSGGSEVKPPAESGRSRPQRLRSLGDVVRALTAEHGRDEIEDQRQKLAEPNVLGVLRLGGRGRDGAAEKLVRRVQQALASANGSGARLKRQLVSSGVVVERIAKAKSPKLFPMQLTVSEVSALIAWPVGRPHVAGLPQGQARHLPATGAISKTGRVVAISNYPGSRRPLALTPVDSLKHVHVIGGTGVGKTTLLANLVAQDVAADHGVVLVEAKGDENDLFHTVLNLVPQHRLEDVIVLDVTDTDMPLGFNVLSGGNPRNAVERLCALFERLYRDTHGVWTREVLFHGLSTLASDPKYTFVDLAPLIHPMTDEDEHWRNGVVASVTDPELKNFWQRFQKQPRSQQERIAQPVMDRIWQLNARPEVRHVIGQSQSSFDMSEALRTGKILLVNLAGLPEATASLTGTLIINSVWAAVQGGKLSKPVCLALDEFQSFLHLPISPEEMLAKSRGYGLAMVLAHQHLGQLPMDLRSAIMANARSKICFQLSADDAMSFAREFGRSVDQADFMNLGSYEVICRLATEASVSQPVTGVTLPPSQPTGLAEQVRQRSREKYGRPVHLVEKEIAERRKGQSGKKRPTVGPVEWR